MGIKGNVIRIELICGFIHFYFSTNINNRQNYQLHYIIQRVINNIRHTKIRKENNI